MDLKEKVRNLPASSGVYLMKDSLDSVIYVGKSKNLKSRVGSYFQNSKAHPPKVVKLVKNLKDFEYILTDTEFEAFMLECKLIQQIKPLYNKKMKSPLSYTYINIKINEKYPDIEVTNDCSKEDGSLYFGPYPNKNTVERAIQGIKDFYKIQCSSSSKKASTCLNYSLGLCIGMCSDEARKKSYNTIVEKIIKMLNGTDRTILKELELSMSAASEKFDFEAAAKYRDYIIGVNYLIDKAKVVEFGEDNKNIALVENLTEDIIKLFLIKGNKVLFSERFSVNDFEKLKSAMKSNILLYFNDKALSSSMEIGKGEIDEVQIIYSYLKNKSNNCHYIVIPEKWINHKNYIKLDKELAKLLNSLT